MTVLSRFLLVSAAAFALPILPALAATDPDPQVASGVRSETRTPGAFTRIALEGPFSVEVRQGPRDAVTLKGDGDVLAKVESVVEGSTLRIRMRREGWSRTSGRVQVVVDAARIDAIALGGKGDIVAKGLKTDKLAISLDGSGNIGVESVEAGELALSIGGNGTMKASGRATTMKVSIAGSGNCETESLAADDVSVAIAGSGDAHVRAEKTLKVSIAGSGNVAYRGEPALTTSVAGSGRVRKT